METDIENRGCRIDIGGVFDLPSSIFLLDLQAQRFSFQTWLKNPLLSISVK
jgi:hypothetical protein